MGEVGAFLKIDRTGRRLPRPRRAGERLPGVPRPAARRRAARPGRALHGVRRAVLPQRLPAGQPHPRLERPRLPRPLARRDRAAARDEQLPRVHRPPVPGAVRGRLRPGDPRGRRGHHQADRELDHRPRVVGGLGRPAAAAAGDRPLGRRRRRGPRGHGRRPAAAPGGPCGRALRARRVRRRPRPLRRAGLQDREARRGAPRRPDARGGRRRPARRRRRRGHHVRRAARASRRGRPVHGLARAARPRGPGPRARRHPLRDGLPVRPHEVRAERHRRRDHRRRQARRRHRRRRHRRRLRRAVGPRGRRVRRAARAAARAAHPPARRPHPVAAVAAEVPPLLRDGGGQDRRPRRAGLRDHDDPPLGRGRSRDDPARRTGRGGSAVRADRGHGARDQGRPRPPRDGLPASRAGAARPGRRREGSARQREGRLAVHDVGPGRVRRGRRPPRPVAHRLGDQRGPPVRPHGRPLSRRTRRPHVPRGRRRGPEGPPQNPDGALAT